MNIRLLGLQPATYSGHRISEGERGFDFLVTSDGAAVRMSLEDFVRMDATALTVFQNWLVFEGPNFTQSQLEELQKEHVRTLRQSFSSKPTYSRADKSGFIYVVRAIGIQSEQGCALYKIGLAKSTESRLAEFGVVMPFSLELIHTMPTNNVMLAERQMHDRYAAKRRGGEWFELSNEDVTQIRLIDRIDIGKEIGETP